MTKKKQILETALKLFIENGFDKTPTSIISKKAGVATGTLFHHFKTKEELIDALYLEIKTNLLEVMTKVLQTKQGIKERFQFIWKSFIAWALENPDRFQFLNQFKESPHISSHTRQKVEETFSFFFDLIDDGKKQGIFHDLPSEVLAIIANAQMTAVCIFFMEHSEKFENESFIQNIFASFWGSLAKID